MSFTQIIEKLIKKQNLTIDEASNAMEKIALGEQLPVEVNVL